MPFQLYPQLPAGYSNHGVVKDELFKQLIDARAPEMSDEQRRQRVAGLTEAWRAEGLCLSSPPTGLNHGGGGRMGSSFDAQRLILLAREQGVEDAMIEEVYHANHTRDECLSDWGVLLRCAERAGVRGAEAALHGGWGVKQTLAKIEEYKAMGISAVPVIVLHSFNESIVGAPLASGAPEVSFLRQALAHLLTTGRLPWADSPQPLPLPQPPTNWSPRATAPPAPAPPPLPSPPLPAPPRPSAPLAAAAPPESGGAHARVLRLLGCSAAPANVLGGSLRRSRERPHAFVVEADFVTCTQ
ncbi:hypothetical protein AB1Y20_019317 [Prymnesium parvum]|uniref:DSBA-like thioredoxin domain-containing protein n=1 Tax=Prymnesium parvum TaxID=97485 RepID=A0AB34JTS4_PRYPA